MKKQYLILRKSRICYESDGVWVVWGFVENYGDAIKIIYNCIENEGHDRDDYSVFRLMPESATNTALFERRSGRY